jgi:hypothetical protein
MNATSHRRARRIAGLTVSWLLFSGTLAWPLVASANHDDDENAALSTVKVNLSEWRVQLNPPTVPPGRVVLEVTNAGSIPHAFEVEGRGASGVHTALVPAIRSSLALWAFAHLCKNDHPVTDNAEVHIMPLLRTRRTSDWALDRWDDSDRPNFERRFRGLQT